MRSITRAKRGEILGGYLFLLPSLLGFVVFIVYPMLNGFYLSFTDFNGFLSPNWIGLDNFRQMAKDPLVGKAVTNNLIYTALQVPGSIALGLLVSCTLYRLPWGKKLFRTLLFFPHITSGVAIAVIWKQLFLPENGLINVLLRGLGVANPPSWIYSSSTSLLSVIIVSIWQSIGFNMIVYLSGLNSIPEDLYEAGVLDGATGLKQFRYITFPLLSPSTFFLTIMGVINSFKVFDIIYQMTEGGPNNSSTVLVHRIYYEGIQLFRFGYASAIALLLFAAVLVVTLIQFRLQDRWVFYSE